MKKTSLAKRNALLSAADVSWGVRALIIVILLVAIRFLAPNTFWSAVAPAYRGADALGAASHSFFAGFVDASALALENDQLRTDNLALAGQNQALLQEISDLKALGAVLEKAPSGVVAGVVARPPESPYDTLVLEGGTAQGIAAGQEAYGPGGVPIGIVSSVLADFSRVTLFSTPGASSLGRIGASSTPITIMGEGAGALAATASRAANIREGDNVFGPGPAAPPIGTVMRVESDPSSPAVTILIQAAVNPSSITWVRLRPAPTSFGSTLSCATSTLP